MRSPFGLGAKQMKDISLRILDMECAACVARLDRALEKLPGVQRAAVNYTAASALITYDERVTDLAAIAARVRRAGFRVPVEEQDLLPAEADAETAAAAAAALRAVFGVKGLAVQADGTLTAYLWPIGVDGRDLATACAGAGCAVTLGELRGGDLAPANEISFLPQAMVQDTALLDFINEVQMYYTDAQVAATALTSMTSQMREGTIRKCDMASIYTYQNTLYKLQMNGWQLRQFMEWSAAFFKTWEPGDVTIAFDSSVRYYLYDAFAGVKYDLDISKQPGNRIQNLTWMDGRPVQDDDSFVVAVNNYRATTQLLTYADIFKEGDELPKLLERSGNFQKGSITGVYTVLVEGDDTNEPIADTVRGILDGHIVLSRRLANSNHFPAIDIGASISRLMADIVSDEHKRLAARVRDVMGIYEKNADLVSVGAYKAGTNPRLDYALGKMDGINQFLTQGVDEAFSYEEDLEAMRKLL